MMINLMLHTLQTILLAGIGLGTSPAAAPDSAPAADVACVTSINVISTMNNGAISVTANGSDCTSECTISPVQANSVVSVSFATNSNQFAYLKSGKSTFSTTGSISTPSSGDSNPWSFSVVGANNGALVTLDPKITVTVGSCTTSI